jgi:hypothetical protein
VNKKDSVGVAYLAQTGNAKHKADGVENVGLATSIQTRDGVEIGIEARDDGAIGVRLEAVEDDFFDVHVVLGFVKQTTETDKKREEEKKRDRWKKKRANCKMKRKAEKKKRREKKKARTWGC